MTFADVLETAKELTYGVVQPGKQQRDGTPIVRVGDIRNNRIGTTDPLRIDPDIAAKFRRSEIQGGELLVTLVGTIGETAVAPATLKGWNTARAVGVARIRADVGARWVARALREPAAAAHIHGRLNTTVQATLNLKDLRETPIILPPLEIREEIALVADALDDKIESNRRAIATISDLLDAISESKGADLPTVPLGVIATSIKDSVNPFKLGDAPVDHFSLPAFDSGARPERVGAATIKSNKLRVPKSAILISRLNPRFNRTWWASAETNTLALASTEFLVLTSEDALELAAVWLAVRDPFFRDELPKRVTGTSGSHQRVRPDDVLTIEVPDFRGAAPDVKQSTLRLLMRAESLRIELDRLTGLRDALLPELMSGRIRVPVSEVAV